MRLQLVACLGLFLGLAGSAAPALAASDRAHGALDDGEPRVEVRLLVHPDRPDAAHVRAGVIFTPDPGWHLYWKNPGDTGLPTHLTWRGGAAGPVAWPAPSAFQDGDDSLITYGYDGIVMLTSEIRLAAGVRTLGVDVDVLLCREMCIPAKLSLERALTATDSGEAAAAVRRLFALHDAALPRAASALGFHVEASLPDAARPERVALAVRACEDGPLGAACRSVTAPAAGPVFFPGDAGVRVVETLIEPDGLMLTLEREGAAPTALRGVLAVRGADGELHTIEVDLAASASVAAGHLLAMLGLAVLGGLLLNLMPCVLPVLALKAFAVAELAGGGRSKALAHGLAYTAGILASMLALAAVVLSLRLAGNEVGWGFQFQSPGFLVVISALCVVFALNLFGVFEIGFVPGSLASVGAEAQGTRRSFFEGLLAVVLATPCSAPFLGTAVGFAFASGGVFVAAIFAAIGLGLAAPFLIICAFPPTARWLPRSGAWMGELRSWLGFALLATVVWLVWVMGRSAGPDAAAGLLALLLAVALGAKLFGRFEERRALRGFVVAAGVALVAVAPNWITADPAGQEAPGAEALAWEPATVTRLRAEGQPILVVFTADWCLTCQMNERTVLESEAVQAALARGGFTVLEADWTRRDETIRRELARFGKAGVPLYLVYPRGAAEPQVLPELLTVERMLTALADREPGHAQPVREADAS